MSQGVIVRAIDPRGPAGTAGLALGDVIVDIDGVPITNGGDLARVLRERRPGQVVPVRVVSLRNGEERRVNVRLGDMPQG